MTRRLLALACLVLVAGGGATAWVSMRGPLAGAKTHDFGTVEVPPDGVKLQHTFLLTNRTGRELVIRKVSTTCGCAEYSTSADHIPPGGRLEVAVTFSMKAHAEKYANVNLDLGEADGLVTLTVSATGKKPEPGR